jgi:hypothetical protein
MSTGTDEYTYRQKGDFISLLLLFQNKENGLQMKLSLRGCTTSLKEGGGTWIIQPYALMERNKWLGKSSANTFFSPLLLPLWSVGLIYQFH